MTGAEAGDKRMPDGMILRDRKNPRGLPDRMAERLIVALDVPTATEAEAIVATLSGTVSFFKIGYWLQFEKGVDNLISSIVDSGKKLFLDAKMYDVPETVSQAIRSAVRRRASFVTIHGDESIMRAAVAARGDSDLKIFAITVLTSLDDAALYEMGYRLPAKELVLLRARKAAECKCDGIIASADDNPGQIRLLAGTPTMLIATPGIRPAGSAPDDQKRIATPREAIANGADYLVVGRPIVANDDPRSAALRIIDDMELGKTDP
jgi:orotidine-5'-phosphate decarboxylase